MTLTFDWLQNCPRCKMVSRAELKICPGCNSSFETKTVLSPRPYKTLLTEEIILKIIEIYNLGYTRFKSIKEAFPDHEKKKFYDSLTRALKVHPYYRDKMISEEEWAKKHVENTFNSGYKINHNNCWIWKSNDDRITILGKRIPIKTYSFEKYYGKMPANFIPRSSCKEELCVNPKHLYSVKSERKRAIQITDKEGKVHNFKAGWEAAKFVGVGKSSINNYLKDKRNFVLNGFEIRVVENGIDV